MGQVPGGRPFGTSMKGCSIFIHIPRRMAKFALEDSRFRLAWPPGQRVEEQRAPTSKLPPAAGPPARPRRAGRQKHEAIASTELGARHGRQPHGGAPSRPNDTRRAKVNGMFYIRASRRHAALLAGNEAETPAAAPGAPRRSSGKVGRVRGGTLTGVAGPRAPTRAGTEYHPHGRAL